MDKVYIKTTAQLEECFEHGVTVYQHLPEQDDFILEYYRLMYYPYYRIKNLLNANMLYVNPEESIKAGIGNYVNVEGRWVNR